MQQQIGALEVFRRAGPGEIVDQKAQQRQGAAARAGKAAKEVGAQGFPSLNAAVGAQIAQVGLVVKQKTALERRPLQDRDQAQQQQHRPAGR